MSYEISYRRQAFRMSAAQAGHYEDLLFLVEEMGSNNCWELDNRRRARSWQCTAVGPEWQCMSEITRRAAACCGGSLVLYGRRRIKPESYIRTWRNTIAQAEPFDQAPRLGFGLQLYRRMTGPEAGDRSDNVFERLTGQTGVTPTERPGDGVTVWEWRFDASDPAQVKLWAETRDTSRAWRSVDVRGPDY